MCSHRLPDGGSRPLSFDVRHQRAAPVMFGLSGWPKRVAIVAVAELAWFGLLYPLVPRNALGFLFEAALLAPAVAFVKVAEGTFTQLTQWEGPKLLRKVLEILIVSVALVFLAVLVYASHRYLGAKYGVGFFRNAG